MKTIRIPVIAVCMLLVSCDRFQGSGDVPLQPFDQAVQAMQRRDFMTARRLFEQEAMALSTGTNQEKLAIVRTYLAEVHLALREFRAAATDLVDARSLFTRMGDKRSGIRLSALKGDIEFHMGKYRKAVESYQEATEAALAFGDELNAGRAELGIAQSTLAAEDPEQALQHFELAFVHAQGMQNTEVLESASLGKGKALRILHKYSEALDVLTTAEQQVGDDHAGMRALFQAEIALVRYAQGHVSASMTGLRDAINLLRRIPGGQSRRRDDEPVLLAHLAWVYEQSQQTDQAQQFYAEAADVARLLGDRLAECYLRAAFLRLQSRMPEQKDSASERWRRLASDFASIANGSGEAYCDVELGLLAERQGAMGAAQEALSRAVSIEQKGIHEYVHPEYHAPLRAILGISIPHQSWYHALARILVKRDRPAEALRVLEMGRMRGLRREFVDIDISVRQPGAKQQTDSIRSMLERMSLVAVELAGRCSHRDLAPTEAEIQAGKAEIEELLKSVRNGSTAVVGGYPNYDLLLPSPVPDMGALKRFVPRGSTLVSFLSTTDRLYVFAMTQQTIAVRPFAISKDSVQRLVKEFKALLLDPRVYHSDASAPASLDVMTTFAALSTRMYQVFFSPIEDLLDRTIIIVTDDLTEGVPFHAIERQTPSGDVKYLVEIAGVEYLPTISSLRYRVLPPMRAKEIVAFGNPSGKNWSVDYELRDLRSFFPSARILVGLETAWTNVQSSSSDVVQIATEFSGQSRINPFGYLVLSNGLAVEGTVSVNFSKLSEMKGSPVMVLSNSSAGGPGMGNLHAALLRMNGTSDVFLNAWSSDRRASKFFSEYFYTHLANGLAPGDAYRQALLNLIRSRDLGQQRAWGQFFHFGLN